MAFGPDDNRVYVVPLIDVNWLVYAPFDPGRNFRVDPPNVPQSVLDTRQLIGEMKSMTDGKFILTPHAGTYCRTGYYEGEMLDVYREAVQMGGELSVHLHEEIKGEGTRYDEPEHMAEVFKDCQRRLEDAGIIPVAYRGGHNAYHPLMNELMEAQEVLVDYSCCPGMNKPDREAIWTHASLSADYIPEKPREPWEGQRRTRILEIPIGSDGEGEAYENILHVEMSELDNLERVWAAIVARAEREERSQIVHCLFHTASVGVPEWLERYRRFLDVVPKRHGQFVTTAEARALHDRFVLEATA
ncbi:hypothetical protein [Amorphus orientalis]|uniref:Uncharacterized protein n=1 Tax=Amorphus orientalis TaxID=649198 RepID=A0AAE3VSM7_9HYPH|nr:hypothetical protein [Amorphus orientalis]MDQ0316866.1 hypothetical protein [Amorphus orientalis]